jgi:putative PIN family toxin of toxin-antitoxin system
VLAILDSNILFSALISPHGAPARIYEAWQEGRFELVTCRRQIEELRKASRYPKLQAILQPHLVGKMLNCLQRARIIEDVPRRHTADDPDDAYLLDLAEAIKVHYLVTGDKRAGLLKRRKTTGGKIVTAADFCREVLDQGKFPVGV